jgi:hypothetical protein
MLRRIFPLIVIFPIIFGGCSTQTEKIYSNNFVGFRVTYPTKYNIKEYKFESHQLSAELKSKEGIIEIRAGGAGTMYNNLPFDQYVKIAAIDQIQNYNKLISIKPFISDSNIKGYETYWEVIQTIPPEEQEKSKELYSPYISGPIYYFQPKEVKYEGEQPLKTISFSCYSPNNVKNPALVNDLQTIAKSFSFN